MVRGYWLPASHETLTAFDGFFVKKDVGSVSTQEEAWERFLNKIKTELVICEPTLKDISVWKKTASGGSRFVALCDDLVDIIAEETDGYFTVYVIIPEDCKNPEKAKCAFPRYVAKLKRTLVSLYPGQVKSRANYRRLIDVG